MDIGSKYLVKPFLKEVNSKKFMSSLNEAKIIDVPTNSGKTHHTLNTFIPHLHNEVDVQLSILLYPTNEVFNHEDANAVLTNTTGVQLVHVTTSSDIKRICTYLDNGIKVFAPMTHQMLNLNRWFIDTIKSKSITGALFIDEAHKHSGSSHWTTYADNQGHHNTKFLGTAYNNASELSKVWPSIFLLTATPTNEHLGRIEPVGSMNFRLITTKPTREEMIPSCAWIGGENFYDLGSEYATEFAFETCLEEHRTKNERLGVKRSLMIACGINTANQLYTTEYVIKLIKQYQLNAYEGNFPKNSVSIITGEGSAFVNFLPTTFGNNTYQPVYEEQERDNILKCLNDPEHPNNIVLFKNLGDCGMNVHSLGSYFSFKGTDTKTTATLDYEEIINNQIQRLGRPKRLWTGIHNTDFTTKWGYTLEEYVKTLSRADKSRLAEINSYDFYLPDNDMNRKAVEVLRRDNPTKSQGQLWLSQN